MKQTPTDELPRVDHDFALRLLDGIRQTSDYEAAVLWLKTHLVYPALRKAKTSSLERIRLHLLKHAGIDVSWEALAVALADGGFTSRQYGGEWSTNVMSRSLPPLSNPPRSA